MGKRDPTRDRAFKMWKEAGGKKAPRGILKEIAEHLNKSVSLIRKWKSTDEWERNITKSNITDIKSNVTNKKKLIRQAKAIVVQGGTLKQASEKVGIPISTLGEYSSKEKWIDQQERFLQKVYSELQEELGETHINDRKWIVKYIHNTVTEIMRKDYEHSLNIKEVALRNETMNFILKSIKGQAELLGIPEMKMYIRKDKEENKENKTSITNIRGKYGL